MGFQETLRGLFGLESSGESGQSVYVVFPSAQNPDHVRVLPMSVDRETAAYLHGSEELSGLALDPYKLQEAGLHTTQDGEMDWIGRYYPAEPFLDAAQRNLNTAIEQGYGAYADFKEKVDGQGNPMMFERPMVQPEDIHDIVAEQDRIDSIERDILPALGSALLHAKGNGMHEDAMVLETAKRNIEAYGRLAGKVAEVYGDYSMPAPGEKAPYFDYERFLQDRGQPLPDDNVSAAELGARNEAMPPPGR